METKFVHFAGIDVSKSKIDVCVIMNHSKSEISHSSFDQSKKGFAAMKKWFGHLSNKQIDKLLVCVENTGLYDDAVLYYLSDNNIAVSLENACNIKRSVRDQRAKNDQLDARNIALYALQHHDELELWQRPRKQLIQLQYLLSERSRLVNTLKMLKHAHKEQEAFSWGIVGQKRHYEAGLKGLQKDIDHIEKDIWELVSSDQDLLAMFTLIVSIPSVGKITAYHFMCYTNEFRRVKSGKQLASYCGVVPFERSSGSSVHKKPRVSDQSNKVLKTLLHLCATTAIKMKGAFAAYYKKKIAEGKPALVAINGIRNKLALTIAAVIKSQKPYDENYVYQP